MSSFERIQVTLSITVPITFNEQRLQQWLLLDGLRFDQPDYLSGNTDNCASSKPVERLIQYWLFFHQQMIIEVGIPYFKPAEINRVQQLADHRYKVTLTLSPVAEFQSVIANSLPPSLALLYDMNNTPFNDETFAALSLKIHHNLYLPLHKAGNAGLSTTHILRYAFEHGIPFLYFGAGLYQLGWGANSHLLHISSTEQDSAIGANLSGYKHFTANRLNSMGLPAAQNRFADSLEKAKHIAHEIGYPVVIKPEKGNRGEGVVKGIDNDDQLHQVWQTTVAFNPLVLVEKQVKGTCYRLFVYDDEVMFVKGTLPRSLTGDGQSTINELIVADAIRQKKCRPWKRQPEIPLDEETLSCLSDQDVSPATILPKHKSVYVRKIGSMQWGVADTPAITDTHPDNLRLAVDAAKAMNLCTAGVDVIIADITLPWYEQECIINEINVSPMIGVSTASIESIAKLMARMLTKDGRIPVSVYVGQQQAFAAAREAQQQRIASGQKCFLTSDLVTYDADNNLKVMTHSTLYQRCYALLLNQSVEALILVVHNNKPVTTGLPVDQIQQLVSTEEALSNSEGQVLDRQEYEAVLSLLEKLLSLDMEGQDTGG